MKCIICSSNTLNINENLPSFSHNKFSTITKNIFFKKCKKCQIIFNKKNIKNSFFKTKQYFIENQKEHKIFFKNKFINRSSIISKLIYGQIKKKQKLKIIDVGCFDGSLLKCLNQKLKKSFLYGFEKNHICKKIFPKKNNFIFRSGKITDLPGEFDIAVFSHSLFYFQDLKKTIKNILLKLKKQGEVFIIIPNINKNPFYFLMGDQKAIFTKINLINIFQFFGLNLRVLKQNYLTNEIILYGKKGKRKKIKLKKDFIYINAIQKIKKIKKRLIDKNIINPVIVGTKVVAAALDEFLKNKTLFFIDQNHNKIIKRFRGKKIILPKEIEENFSILSSFTMSQKLKEYLNKKYNLKIINYDKI